MKKNIKICSILDSKCRSGENNFDRTTYFEFFVWEKISPMSNKKTFNIFKKKRPTIKTKNAGQLNKRSICLLKICSEQFY